MVGEVGKDSPRLDCVDEQSICNEIPISKFKSNHLSKRREMQIKVNSEEIKDEDFNQLSPSATQALRDQNFKNIDHPSILQAAMKGISKFKIGSPE